MPKKSSTRPPIKQEVVYELRGKQYQGTYYVTGGLLTLDCEYGSKSARPGPIPELIAKTLLRELVQEAEQKGWL